MFTTMNSIDEKPTKGGSGLQSLNGTVSNSQSANFALPKIAAHPKPKGIDYLVSADLKSTPKNDPVNPIKQDSQVLINSKKAYELA